MNSASRVVAVRSPGGSSDPHFEVAVHIELQHKTIAALRVRRPRRLSFRHSTSWRRGVSRNPDVVVLIDVNTVFVIGPDAASFGLTFASYEAGVGWTSPGTQQLALRIELQN